MDLWIRSQDRENLIPVNNPICIIDTRVVYKESATYIITLAEYKTKERALEVLDEIQDRILKGAFAKKINGLGEELDLIPNNLLIYQMPKG